MWFGRLFWFGAGAAVGLAASQLLARPEGRALVKRAVKGGLSLRDLVVQPWERFREDVSDLAAEAREEYEQERLEPASVEHRLASSH